MIPQVLHARVHRVVRRVLTRPRIDLPLAAGLFLLALIGLATLYSAGDQSFSLVGGQAARFVLGGATDGAIAAAAFLAAGRRRAGAEAAASRTLAPGLPAVVGAFLFDGVEECEPVFLTGALRDVVFFAAALPSAFARCASGAA